MNDQPPTYRVGTLPIELPQLEGKEGEGRYWDFAPTYCVSEASREPLTLDAKALLAMEM